RQRGQQAADARVPQGLRGAGEGVTPLLFSREPPASAHPRARRRLAAKQWDRTMTDSFDNLLPTRRHFLATQAMGISSLALAWLLRQDARAAPAKPPLERLTFDLKAKPPHREPKARAMISLFMQGGP